MDSKVDSKRKMYKYSDNDDRRRETRSRKYRSRSRSREDRGRRKRRHSRSISPNIPVKQERRRDDVPDEPAKKAPERKAKETDMLNTRTGGAYIPPARLRMMQAQITDKSSVAYQRLAWEALKKSIHGHINKINVGNIGIIIKELLKENIVRGRGLLCRSVIQAQAASPTFTNVYAALVAAVNSRFPNIGELLLKRLVIQFKRGFKRNDKPTCISSASFIAHLVNQRVAHEILALELLTLLVESPTDDSVEVAIAFLKECGQKLTEVSSKGVNAIFEMLRNILHEGQLDKRVQYMIEVMFQVWKDGFKDHPALIEELELVPEEEQFTHLLMLDDATDAQDILNVFKFDEKYEDNEQKYKTLSKEILGSDAESGEEDGSEESGSEESDDEEGQEGEQKGMTIIDNTETNLVALRRTIYLTINSSLDFEECAHKLMKMQLKPGQEVELCHMFLDCCAEQRTYEKFYGLLAQRFCNINRMYIGPFEEIFKDSYATAHRLDTNRLRNVSKFFAHLLFTDSISWEVMECVKLNEEDTTSSSRIYIKILFQELAEYMGLKKLNDRLRDPTLQDAFAGVFPRDNPKNTRFSINFFTSIGLGGLTDELREHLKQMPKNVPAPVTNINVESESSSESSSSSSSSDSSSSDSSSSGSEEESEEKKSKKSKEKGKSKPSNDTPNEDSSYKENNDKDKRWGHDGFYDTYGENARRHNNREERSEPNRDNFARPRDVSRRYGDREKDNERGSRDRYYRDTDRYRNERSARDTEDVRGKRSEADDDQRRPDRDRVHERRRGSVEDRSERNAKDDKRYDNERSNKDRSDRNERMLNSDNGPRKDSREDKRQDKDRKRDNRDELTTNRNDKVDDRSRDPNSKKDNRDKNSKDSSLRNSRDNNMNTDERDSGSKEEKNDRGKKRYDTNKTNKYNDVSDDDDSRNRHKESKSKGSRKEDDSRDKLAEERNRREDRDKNNKDNGADRNNAKDKNKKTNRKKYESKSNSSQEEAESESSSDDENSRSRKREKEKRKRQEEKSKKKDDSADRKNSKNKSKKNKNNSEKYKEKRHSSHDESEDESSSDEEKNKRRNKDTEKKKRQGNKTKKGKDESGSRKKNKRDKDKETSSESSEESNSEDNSEYEINKSGSRYWDTFDIETRQALEKSTKQKGKRKEIGRRK